MAKNGLTWVETFIFTTNISAIYLHYIGNIFAQPFLGLCFRLSARHGADDVAVAGVGDRESADPEVLAARGAQLVVVAGVVVDTRLGQHSIVLNLRPGRYILNLRVQQ